MDTNEAFAALKGWSTDAHGLARIYWGGFATLFFWNTNFHELARMDQHTYCGTVVMDTNDCVAIL